VWLTRDPYCLNLSHHRFPLASQSTRGKNRESLELEAGFSNQTVWLHKHSPMKKTKRNNYFQPAERNNNTTYLIIANNQQELEAKAPSWCQARESVHNQDRFSPSPDRLRKQIVCADWHKFHEPVVELDQTQWQKPKQKSCSTNYLWSITSEVLPFKVVPRFLSLLGQFSFQLFYGYAVLFPHRR